TCCRRPMSRTCTGRTVSAAPPPGQSKSRASELAMKIGRLILATAGAAAIAAALGSAWWMRSLGPVPSMADVGLSTQVLDRNGRLLRAYATPEGRWRLPATVANVDPRFLDMLQAYEDRRFRDHAGVDPLAMLRAAWQWLGNGRVISGGSTLTMQVA